MKLRRTLVEISDGCSLTAGMLALLPGMIIMKAMNTSGTGVMLGSWALGGVLTSPVTLPLLLVGQVLDKTFFLGPVRERMREEERAKNQRLYEERYGKRSRTVADSRS